MSILKGLCQCLAALAVLALFVGVIVGFFTLVWMVRFIILIVVVVALVMYLLNEAFAGLFQKKRRGSQ